MPIRINLKELFSIDSQDITVDKLNFNFNKLLELGIGQEGPIGPTGPEGSAGPIGLTGGIGQRGSLWFIDTFTDPNGNITTGLFNNDLYIGSSDFKIWQYSESTSPKWSEKANIGTIVQNYLSLNGETFVRGTNTSSAKYILFPNRGNIPADVSGDNSLQNNTSKNDVLYLNNFNEIADTTISHTIDNALATALSKISVDHRVSNKGRYHLELSSLTGNALASSVTALKHNFKLRYFVNGKLSGDPVENVGLNVSRGNSGYINTTLFSLDIPENLTSADRDYNAQFDFRLPKYYLNNPLYSFDDNDELHVQLGSVHALSADLDQYSIFLGDGIRISSKQLSATPIASYDINLGIWRNAKISNLPTSSSVNYFKNTIPTISENDNYLVLDGSVEINGIFLNKEVFQDGGNIVQLGAKAPDTLRASRFVIESASQKSVPLASLGNISIASNGSTIYTLGGVVMNGQLINTAEGYSNTYSIDNPLNPTLLKSVVHTGETVYLAPSACPNYNLGENNPIGGGISDFAILGNYGFVVNNVDIYTANTSLFERTYLQVVKLQSDDLGGLKPKRINRLGYDDLGANPILSLNTERVNNLGLMAPYRIKLKDNFAYIATNALHLGATNSKLGRLGDFDSSHNDKWYTGTIAKVDISELDGILPILHATPIYVNDSITGSLCSKATMDIALLDDKIYTVTWEQTLATNCKVSINLQVYDDSLTLIAKGANPVWYNGSINNVIYPTLSKHSAIAVNSRHAFIGYEDTIHVYNTRKENCSGVATLTKEPSLVLTHEDLVTSTSPEILDIQLIGSTLYVLSTRETSSLGKVSSVIKIDISNPSNIKQVWEYTLFDVDPLIGSKFIVQGKHIWVATHSNSIAPVNKDGGLVLVDYDGIYTAGAHIESLHTDQIHVNKNITVNQDLEVNGDSKIGGNSLILGNQNTYGNSITTGNGLFKGTLTSKGDFKVNDTFTVDAFSGNTFIKGQLSVNNKFTVDPYNGDIFTYGDLNINNTFIIDSLSGDAFIKGDLNINNTFKVDSATGNTIIYGGLDIGPGVFVINSQGLITTDFQIGVDQWSKFFTVDVSTGNTYIEGDTFIKSKLEVEGNFNAYRFSINGSSGSVVIKGNLFVQNQSSENIIETDRADSLITFTDKCDLTIDSTITSFTGTRIHFPGKDIEQFMFNWDFGTNKSQVAGSSYRIDNSTTNLELTSGYTSTAGQQITRSRAMRIWGRDYSQGPASTTQVSRTGGISMISAYQYDPVNNPSSYCNTDEYINGNDFIFLKDFVEDILSNSLEPEVGTNINDTLLKSMSFDRILSISCKSNTGVQVLMPKNNSYNSFNILYPEHEYKSLTLIIPGGVSPQIKFTNYAANSPISFTYDIRALGNGVY